MADLITDFIDEKAFAQFERLHKALSTSQEGFARVISSAADFNAEFTKAKGIDDLISKMNDFEKVSKKVGEAEKEQAKTLEQLEAAEAQLLAGVKARIESAQGSTTETKKMNASFEEQIKTQLRLKAELSGLKVEQKNLDKGVKDGIITNQKAAEMTAKLAKEETLLKQELTTTNQEIKRSVKEQQSAAGSSDQLSVQLDKLRANYRGLSKEERENADVGGLLLTQIQELDTEMKGLDKSQGVHTREVGNYKLATDGLTNSMGNLSPMFRSMTMAYKQGANTLSSLSNAVKTYVNGSSEQLAVEEANTTATITGTAAKKASAVATGGVSKALKVLRIAILGTGIGVLVIALGALISYFTGTQEGVDKLTKVTRPLQAIFTRLKDLFQKMGGVLVDLFSNPMDSIKKFAAAIKDNIVNRFVGLMELIPALGKAIGLLFKGEFKEAGKVAGDAMGKVVLGVEGVTDKIGAAGKATKEFIQNAIAEGKRLDDLDKKIRANNIALIRDREKLNRLIEEEKAKSRDASLTSQEREIAAKRALVAINELHAREAEQLDLKIEKMALEQKMSGNLDADNVEFAELQAEKDALAAKVAKDRVRITSTLNSLVKEGAKLAQDAINKELEQRELLSKRVFELSMLKYKQEETDALRASDNYKKLAEDENLGFEQRLENLSLYAMKKGEAIDLVNDAEAMKIEQGLAEAIQLEKEASESKNASEVENKKAQAQVIRDIVQNNLNELSKTTQDHWAQLNAETAKEQMHIIATGLSEENKTRLAGLQQGVTEERQALELKYAEGKIKTEEYELEKYNITRRYNDAVLINEIETIEKIIAANKAKGQNTSKQEQELARLKMEQSKNAADAQIKDLEKVKEKEEKVAAARKELAKATAALVTDLINDQFERESQNLEAKMEGLDRETERKKLAIEQEVLGAEDRRIKLAEIDAKAANERIKIEEEQKKIKVKQAKFNKLTAALNVGVNTAVGVSAALATLNIPLSIVIGALGAVQLASVLAQPIPKYAVGTNYSKEGLAIVGERGSELFQTPTGEMGLTPNKESLTYLQRGTKIIDANRTARILQNVSNIDIPKNDGNFIDVKELIRSGKKNTEDLRKAINSRPEHRTILTKRGLRNVYKNGATWNNYKNHLLN